MFWQATIQSPASPDMERWQRGQCGQLYLSWPRHSVTSRLHRIILKKMPCQPLRGSSSFFVTEQTLQPISTRHAINCLQRPAMSSGSHQQVQHWTAHPMSNIPGWICLESDPGSCTNIVITNWLGLDQNQRYIWTSLDTTSRGIQSLPGAGLQMTEELRQKV